MRSNFIVLGCVLAGLYVWYYYGQFNTPDDRIDIQANLSEWLSRGSSSVELKVADFIRLDDSDAYIALFQLENGGIGYAQLSKGWNGRYKIERSGHGSNLVSYEKIETNKGVYGLIVGKNPAGRLASIKAQLYYSDFAFTSDVSEEYMFVKYKKVPKDTVAFPADLFFYDQNGKSIDYGELES
ncbi:hypothetical protein A8F94_22265 [Bacillus sp. FJAT-27225]|uniref:hypothetical protein n=1 Tax=Bacillus sp. FJAT-27225 TaxID=1743144 RepID=UPI00080C3024|nr:hypothetical protein [Bacillus sp. FJAT-27225]OCA81596.1 hypothetical protein A8F94_22265 [Bacillus sp. FJAT-27225]